MCATGFIRGRETLAVARGHTVAELHAGESEPGGLAYYMAPLDVLPLAGSTDGPVHASRNR